MDMPGNLIGADKDLTAQGNSRIMPNIFIFLFQLLQYDPNAKEKLHNLAITDYAYRRAAIERAIKTGALSRI